MAHKSIDDIFEYLCNYSIYNALQTINLIYNYIYSLADSPYIGRLTQPFNKKKIREFIFRKNKNSSYKIIYYISETTQIIHIIYVSNCKKDFNSILKIHNYFNNYLDF